MIKEWIEKERRFDYSFVIIPNGSETPIGMVGLGFLTLLVFYFRSIPKGLS